MYANKYNINEFYKNKIKMSWNIFGNIFFISIFSGSNLSKIVNHLSIILKNTLKIIFSN